MQVNKLRLAGFKSFVDATELSIAPGLTGVVGPNGCGKSNLLEALRWVMGETSPKSMRGEGMDNVIFGGSANRPSRDVAEVVLGLDNAERDAPAAYNDQGEIEVSRRIERGAGSTYRINGREVRARDVQLLFADLVTGAHSTAMVSQGHIGALIEAKPIQRRVLLEEAAGITGLHSRRHEAELRLSGAETNLERLDDVLQALDGQLKGLKRQAAQARRYRRLSEHIRRQEAILLHLQWSAAGVAVAEAEVRLEEAEATVNQRTELAAAAATRQAENAAVLPRLRQAEAAAAAELQRLLVTGGELEAEEARLTQARDENRRRREQIGGDLEREKTLAADAHAACRRLEDERTALEAARQGEAEAETAAKGEVEAAQSELGEAEGRLTDLTERVAAIGARKADLDRRIEELERRMARLGDRRREVAEELRRLEASAAEGATPGRPSFARRSGLREGGSAADAALAERRVDEARAAADEAEGALAAARGGEEQAREAARLMDAEWAGLTAEESALARLSTTDDRAAWPPVIEALTVDPGFEAALAAALGDDLTASLDPAAPAHWDDLGSLTQAPALPAACEPLAAHVRAPEALARRLTQVGVVADRDQGRALKDRLEPGQRLVSRDGGLWRWDGFTVERPSEAGAASRLEQRNRLETLRDRLPDLDARRQAAVERAAAARAATDEAAAAERAAREALQQAHARRDAMREHEVKRLEKAAAARSRRVLLDDLASRLDADLGEGQDDLAAALKALAESPDPEAARDEVGALQAEVAERRARLVEARSACEVLGRAAAERRRWLGAIDEEVKSWRARAEGAEAQIAALEARLETALAEDRALAARPAEIAAQRRVVHDKIDEAERRRGRAADRLARAETALGEADRRLRQAEGELAAAREGRVRLEAEVAQAQERRDTVAERIAERLDCSPEETPEVAGLTGDDRLPEPGPVQARLERLLRERDTMGPVNLRAEQEADELGQQIAGMRAEREDLIAAITRLRQGIAALDREGRERLLASFATVNKHFEELFVRLFGGGRAHLELTGEDDPLQAGLEIMASPPGKRLQVLSLLSGGEQALTATALMFAVFLTNPAPVCALDEVDAMLDDANVDRFCTLLESIARGAATRFLVITHHRMTMARMDRLFGVTMAERGISQLVSVDLRQAERLKATA